MNENAHVMIVDDDEVLLDLMSRRLERLGLNLDRASNGGEALDLVQRNQYALVVTDIYMPIATGLDVLISVKEKDSLAQVIMITGGGTIEIALEGLERGAFMYLTKPFDDLEVFDHVVNKSLEYRRLLLAKGGSGSEAANVQSARENTPMAAGQNPSQLSEGSLRILLSLPDAVMLINEQGQITFANPAARAIVEDGWDYKSIAPEDFEAALSERSNGLGVPIKVENSSYRLKAVEIPEEFGGNSILFQLHPHPQAENELVHIVREPLKLFKKGLAWLYHQRLREQEFRVLRAMAAQVSIMERFSGKNGNSNVAPIANAQPDKLIYSDPGKILPDGPQ